MTIHSNNPLINGSLVYLYHPHTGVLLMSRALQHLYALPVEQRLSPPKRWFNCHPPESQRQLRHAFAALCFANDDNRMTLALKLTSTNCRGQLCAVEHRLCMVTINEQRFICGRVSPIWNPHCHRPASYQQSAYWSARPFREISQSG